MSRRRKEEKVRGKKDIDRYRKKRRQTGRNRNRGRKKDRQIDGVSIGEKRKFRSKEERKI